MAASLKNKTSILLLIATVALASWVVSNFQSSDLDRAAISTDVPNESNDRVSQSSSDPPQTDEQRIIYRGDPPYLIELPILDGNLFVNHSDDYLLFGGTNIEQVRFSAGTRAGGRATVLYRDNAIAFVMSEQPYVEFAYQDGFYSIQILSRSYFFTLDIRELPSPSVELTGKFERVMSN
jgi:hypothetical protein